MPEREVKLEAAPHFHLPDLGSLVPGIEAGAAVDKRLHTTYWDTADLRLARWGCSLRFRRGEGWTVKLPAAREGDMLVRGEHTFPGGPKEPAAGAVDLLRAYVRDTPLLPAATLSTRRVSTMLKDERGAEVAEVVDDVVSVMDGRRLALRFRELEVEARDDSTPVEVMQAIVGALRAAGAGAPNPTAKHVRALGPRSTELPEINLVDLEAEAVAGGAARRAIGASVVRLLRHDAGVRLGLDPEDIHQARVATRRLRSDLRTFGSLLDPEWSEPLRDELGWIAALLGDVRDPEVMIERISGELEDVDERRRGMPLLRLLSADREKGRVALLEAFRSDRYVDLLNRLVDAAHTPRLSALADAPAAAALPPLARRSWERLETKVRSLGRRPADGELHEVRILAKRARYAAEAVAPVVGTRATEFAAAAAEVQTVLGDHQDAIVAGEWLREHAGQLTARAAFVAGMLAEREHHRAGERRKAWPEAWDKLDRKRMRRWMDGD